VELQRSFESSDTCAHYHNVVAIGIDLIKVRDVRDSLAEFGERYLRRLFTNREQIDCCSSADPIPRLAARYAAKEATIKALKVNGCQPVWTSMEVWRNPLGWCDEMRLSGAAARLAVERGVGRLHVSLSHEDDAAIAVVLATRAHSSTLLTGQPHSGAREPGDKLT
jgi:holo-[acyl-carrier protein] synthase